MKKVVIILAVITFLSYSCLANVVLANVVWHRYYDKITGEERGGSNSGRDGSPAINNPDWDYEVITDDSQKEFYLNLHKEQMKAKDKAIKDAKKALRKSMKTKLKDLGFSNDELYELLGDTN